MRETKRKLASVALLEADLQADFEDAWAQFCELDAGALLNQTRWREVLSSCAFQVKGCANANATDTAA